MLGYDAPRWHAVLNDFPATLLVVAVLFDLAGAAFRRESLKWAGIWALWAGVIGGWASVVAGELAEGGLEHGEAIHDLMERHERLAFIAMSVFTVILGWKMYRRFVLPAAEEVATRLLGVVGIAGLIWVGSIGGRLVFEHAAGVSNERLRAELRDRRAMPMVGDTMQMPSTHVDPPGTPPHKH